MRLSIVIRSSLAICAICLLAAGPATAQTITLDLAGGGSVARSAINLFLLSTLLAVAPTLVIVGTSFTRVVVVLSLLRSALGLQQTPPNIVITTLAIFMTLFIMAGPTDLAISRGVEPYLNGTIGEEAAIAEVIGPFREFMLKNTRREDLDVFLAIAQRNAPDLRIASPADIPIRVVLPAFMLSELRVAFEIGFLIYLPFLVIDLAVSAILMAMGMMMVPPVLVALPFKLVYFVFADGWRMLVSALVDSYAY
jgi:flagellar biosynthetic protein FliP